VNRAFRPFRSKRGELPQAELRARCEAARLDLRSLFLALDRRRLFSEIPSEVRAVMELDADLAEALWVLDGRQGRFDLRAMEQDTLASLSAIPAARDRVLDLLTVEEREEFLACMSVVRQALAPEEAYADIPIGGPRAG
jgi:hypothetical protein